VGFDHVRAAEVRARLFALLAAAIALPLAAHEVGMAEIDVTFHRDGTYVVELPKSVAPGAKLMFDDKLVAPERTENVSPSRIRMFGTTPHSVSRFTFSEDAIPGYFVLTLHNAGESQKITQWIVGGSTSEPFALDRAVVPKPRLEIIALYLRLGFTHIFPRGLDHVLFVLGIFLLAVQLRPVLWQVSAFTIAHTITLALTIYGVVSLPPRIVEPLIALSIVYVAVENVFTSKLHAWRPLVVFCFGLLHGMGFAGVLSEIGLPRSEFVPALLAFNVGVEGGQLTVILVAFLTIGLFRNKPWYRRRVVIPCSLAIAATGLYWSIERVFFAT
jgi:hydrogenase/urease accessory protein HupE